MESGTVDPTPDLEDLLQETPTVLTVPVRVEGAVMVHSLPSREVQYQTDRVISARWDNLFRDTPKRGRGVLISLDQPIEINATNMGSGMVWPAGVPYQFEHKKAVWVRAYDPAGSGTVVATVGSSVELWAD